MIPALGFPLISCTSIIIYILYYIIYMYKNVPRMSAMFPVCLRLKTSSSLRSLWLICIYIYNRKPRKP